MSTATASKKKKKRTSKKKKSASKKTTARGRSSGKTKKPKWSVVTFKQIEQWRQKIGLPKSGMAEALGVTNSTYHNWQRGTTVPHPNQQHEIHARLQALETGAIPGEVTGSEPTPTAPGHSIKGAASARNGAVSKRGRGALAAASASRRTPSGDRRESDGGSEWTTTQPTASAQTTPASLLSVAKVLRTDGALAAITVAWIESHKTAPSAGSVMKFITQLRESLG